MNVKHQSNIAYLCSDFHCDAGHGNQLALLWIHPDFSTEYITFDDLKIRSNQIANILVSLNIKPGDRIGIFLPKVPQMFYALLGVLKVNAIACPLFSTFGEDALLDRLVDSDTTLVITRKSLLRKVTTIKDRLPSLRTILLIDAENNQSEDILSLPLLLKSSNPNFLIPHTSPETPSLLHYTSGSTGKPKGVLHQHGAASSIKNTMEEVIQLQEDELYWCTADQAWITGTSYGVFGPWLIGAPQVQYGGAFSFEKWCQILELHKVQRWFTAPTALRMMIQQEENLSKSYNFPELRAIFSVGEPLNPEVIHWGKKFFGLDIHDTWFQTETGSIMIANRPGIEIRPGSMGQPVNGIKPAIVSDDGSLSEVTKQGNLCISPKWDSMFVTYWNNPSAYQSKFKNSYYYTGDMAWKDEDGYYWFVGRSDDVINTAGHLVSPFEVESALLEIPEVIDAGVIAGPDPVIFECVIAYIRLKQGITLTTELELRIKRYISNRVSSIACPKQIIPVDSIPHNRSGKIMRRVLKAWFTGSDPGDLSTIEVD